MTYIPAVVAACCCREPVVCTFYSDSFGNADVEDNYTIISGTPSLVFGSLVMDDSNTRIDAITVNPTDANTRIQATFTISSGDTAKIFLDSGNWHVEVKAGTGAWLRIYQGATLKATCSPTIAAGDILVCASISTNSTTGAQTIRVSLPNLALSLAAGGTFSGTGWGLGTGTISNPVIVDNLTARYVNDDCTACADGTCGTLADCTACCGGDDADLEFTVDLGTGGWTDSLCAYCDQVHGEFNLTYLTTCQWQYYGTNVCTISTDFSGHCSTQGDLSIILTANLSGGKCSWTLTVRLGPSSCDNVSATHYADVQYISDPGDATTFDCLTSGPWTLIKDSGESPGDICGGSMPATITVTRAA